MIVKHACWLRKAQILIKRMSTPASQNQLMEDVLDIFVHRRGVSTEDYSLVVTF